MAGAGFRPGTGSIKRAEFLTPQAVKQAADAAVFPEQLSEGLKPWSVGLLLEDRRSETKSGFRVPLEQISALRGESYSDFGRESLVYHRSQGVTMFVSSPFFRSTLYLVIENPQSDAQTLSPADLAKNISALAIPSIAAGLDSRKPMKRWHRRTMRRCNSIGPRP